MTEDRYSDDMAFLRSLFKDPNLPASGWDRKMYIDLCFDEFFGITRYDQQMFERCGFAAQTMHPTLDMTYVTNYKGMMESYINTRIAEVFPGVTFFDFANQPKEIIETMIEVANSDTGKRAIADSKARQQMNALLGKEK